MALQRTGAWPAPRAASVLSLGSIRGRSRGDRLGLRRFVGFGFLALFLGLLVELIFARGRRGLEHAADLLPVREPAGHRRQRCRRGEDVDRRLAAAAHRPDGRATMVGIGFVRVTWAYAVALLLEAPRGEDVGVDAVTVGLHRADDDLARTGVRNRRCGAFALRILDRLQRRS